MSDNQNDKDALNQAIRPVGSGLASSPEALAAMAAMGINPEDAIAAQQQETQAVPVSPFGGGVPVQAPPVQQSVATFGNPNAVPVQGQPVPTAGTMPIPGVAPVQAPPVQQAPAYANPIQAPVSNGEYSLAGSITVEEMISGDPQRYAHLDSKIEETVTQVQKVLVENGMADQLPNARFDPELRLHLAQEIDRLALGTLLQGRSTGGKGETPVIVASTVNEIIGLGPLEPLWQDPNITEVIVNGPNDVYVERSGKLLRARGVRFRSQEHLLEICQRILSPLNRKLDVKDPLADGRLPDGSRVNAVHQAVSPEGPLLTIRRFPQVNRSIVDLVELGAMSKELAQTVTWLVANKASSLVVGGTGTGKTTMLNALSAAIPLHERVITIEDSLELRLNPESHVAAMEARPADASGSNAVPIRALVKNALRMRPDRIIVGEIRDQAALDMLQACNTGHEGSMSTVHANGPNEAVSRLAVMVAQGGEIPADKVDWLVGSALDLIIMIRRYKDGSRRIAGLYEVPEADNLEPGQQLTTIPLFEWIRTGEDENGKLLGEYREINEVSDRLKEKLGLEFEPKFTWEDVLRLSGVQQ